MATESTKLPTEPAKPERASSFSLDVERRTIPSALTGYVNRLRSGEPGALPSVLGLVVLIIIFSQVSSQFLTKNNFGNLPNQGAYIAIIGLGLVFVLLLGEIDLSAGTTGGMCAGFAVQSIVKGGLKAGQPGLLFWALIIGMVVMIALGVYFKTYLGPAVVAIGLLVVVFGGEDHVLGALVLAIAIGAAVGILIGVLVAYVGIPSFIVTLALFLAWQGVLNFALHAQGQSVSNYQFWNGLANKNMSVFWSWVFVLVLVGGYLAFTVVKSIRSTQQGLSADTLLLVLVRGGVIAALGIVVVILANENRNPVAGGKPNEGLPWAASIPVALMIVCSIALTKTQWGRHLFAIGGNAEAARRAGIDVTKMKITAFMLCSAFGALGGIFLASYTGGVQLDLGAGNVLLFSVAAAVIGGTSLFGGRGKARDAIIGGLVIVMIPNGIGLKPSLSAQLNYIITGGVLLVAAAVDAVSRRRSRLR